MSERQQNPMVIQTRISILEKRIKLLREIRGAALMDRNGAELFDTFEVPEAIAIQDALTKYYRDEIENLKRNERVMSQ